MVLLVWQLVVDQRIRVLAWTRRSRVDEKNWVDCNNTCKHLFTLHHDPVMHKDNGSHELHGAQLDTDLGY